MRGYFLAAALCFLAGHAAADPVPTRQSGLWQNTVTITDMTIHGKPYKLKSGKFAPDTVTVICDPGALPATPVAPPAAGDRCPAPTVKPGAAGSYTITETCARPDGTTSFSGTLVFDGDRATHLTMHMTSPGMSSTMREDSKWLGACPAGIHPGDFGVMSHGKFKKLLAGNPPPD